MNTATLDRLRSYIKEGDQIERADWIASWQVRVEQFLSHTAAPETLTEFKSLSSENEFRELAMKLGFLEGLIAKESNDAVLQPDGPHAHDSEIVSALSKRVFVVHGHDEAAKEGVARFLEKIGLEATILHEQPNRGATIIEKFERSSGGVSFAVVLLTPDDVGGEAPKGLSVEKMRPRARQNVVLELGYFVGRLGRARVCALHKGNVELPSDFNGVVYIELDSAGAWKTKLAQELVEAKLTIDVGGLMK
jgi:predicted nucleotide-binding protein